MSAVRQMTISMDNAVFEWFLTPMSYGFFQRGLFASLIVGILCSIVGCYIVLRSMAFLGDAMAHAVLPGVAVAYLLGGNLLIGALAAAIAVALGIGFFTRHALIKEDTAIGILFIAALSLGIVLISSIRSYAVDLSHILFGNVLGVSAQDLWLTILMSLIVVSVILIFYRKFLVISFDPVLAVTLRLKINFLRNLLLVMVAITIVIALQTVGVGLVAAMLVTPAATAYLVVKRLPAMMVLSAVIGAFSSISGLFLSYYINISSGATIVFITTLIFIAVYLFSPRKGIFTRFLQQKKREY